MCLDMRKWQEMAGAHSHNRSTGPGRLAGKISVVTGAAQAFGRGVAEELYREGAYVVIADRNLTQAQDLAGTLGERAIAVSVDLTDEESVANLVAKTVEHFGGLDLMVANSGVDRFMQKTRRGQAEEDTEARMEQTGVLLCCRYAALIMQAQHKSNPSAMYDIVAMSSRPALEEDSNQMAARYGGIGLVEEMALELYPQSIKVNAIWPPERERIAVAARSAQTDCRPVDMARAVVHCVEQQYETGQARSVTAEQG